MSPSEWRDGGYEQRKIGTTNRKVEQAKSKQRKALQVSVRYRIDSNGTQAWRMTMNRPGHKTSREVDVEVKEIADLYVAYMRHVGPYQGDGALFQRLYDQLFRWAGPRNLLAFPQTKIINVYHDDPDITEPDKLRLSACITVPEGTRGEGEIGTMSIQGGRYAQARSTKDYPASCQVAAWLPGPASNQRQPTPPAPTSRGTDPMDMCPSLSRPQARPLLFPRPRKWPRCGAHGSTR
jgi:AraC family transcriptional regulator